MSRPASAEKRKTAIDASILKDKVVGDQLDVRQISSNPIVVTDAVSGAPTFYNGNNPFSDVPAPRNKVGNVFVSRVVNMLLLLLSCACLLK